MIETNLNAIRAKENDMELEAFIKNNEGFIIKVASKISKKYITKDSDEWSISLSAFCEAVKTYDEEKGSFLGFCELVIKRRLYDYKKKELKHSVEFSVDPVDFSCEPNEDDNTNSNYKIIAKLSTQNDDGTKLEIEAIIDILKDYDISFFDLASVSPKAEKTKNKCAQVVVCLLKSPELLRELRLKKLLPIKKLSNISKVPQKILERHRKYIIAGAEILDGDFPIISEYLSYIRKEL